MDKATSKSVRILNEFQEEAKKNIIQQINISSPLWSGVCIWFLGSKKGYDWHCRIKMDGELYQFNGKIDRDNSRNVDLLGSAIYKEISKQFLSTIKEALKEAFEKAS